MRRIIGLAVIVVVGMTGVVLGSAGSARASASFDSTTGSGFISRGDVIAAGGKSALVADPYVVYDVIYPFTETCTWPDGISVQASGSSFLFLLFRAETRYAPGSGTITGYTFSWKDLLDGETDPVDPTLSACWGARGGPYNGSYDDSTITQQEIRWSPAVRTLSLNGTVLPFHETPKVG